jgi:transposase-like protein
MAKGASAEKAVKEIRHKTRRKFSAEEKIRIVLEGLRGEESTATLCRREGIVANLYYRWSKEFLEAGKKRLQGEAEPRAKTSALLLLPSRAPQSSLPDLDGRALRRALGGSRRRCAVVGLGCFGLSVGVRVSEASQ